VLCDPFYPSSLLLLLNRLPPDITGGQGLKKTFFKQYIYNFTKKKDNV
jgi:hypothetical protein